VINVLFVKSVNSWEGKDGLISVCKIYLLIIMDKIFSLPVGLELINGTLYMFQCPKCQKENIVANIATGVCSHCGYDAKPEYAPHQNNEPQN